MKRGPACQGDFNTQAIGYVVETCKVIEIHLTR